MQADFENSILTIIEEQARVIAEQGAKIDSLVTTIREHETRLNKRVTLAENSIQAPVDADGDHDRHLASRRALLRLAGAGVVGAFASTAISVHPAAAADGNAINIGNTNSTSSGTNFYTVLDYSSSATPTAGLVVRDSASHLFGGAIIGQADNLHGIDKGVIGYLTGPNFGIGVLGQTEGPGSGVAGVATSGFGLFGSATTGYSVYVSGNGRTGRVSHLASGPPISGSYAQGDEVRDSGGNLFCCVTAGSPGTWRKIAGPSTAGSLHMISGSRVLSNVTMNGSQTLPVDCSGRVPAGATAVLVTILAYATTADGYQTCYAEGTANPLTISCYWAAGAQMATAAVVPISAARRFSITLTSAGSAGAAVDISGYYA